jgi:plasmid maintenance system killer protein
MAKTAAEQKANEIYTPLIAAMGGQDKWDAIRYISWNFFGARDLVWDKWQGRVRIESPQDSTIYLINVNTMQGRVQRGGIEITHADSLAKELENAKSIWINDSYWVAMPWKLRDPGVTMKYLRDDTTQTGAAAHVCELTFEGVGDTPQNKYEIYVDQKDNLIKQWAYFREGSQENPSAIWPWDNYKEYDGVLLSGDRSDQKGPFNIKVDKEMDDVLFEEF